MSHTRIYLKSKPAINEAERYPKFQEDDFGWYYFTDQRLEILRLPPAIKQNNIDRVTVHIRLSAYSLTSCIHDYRNGEYRHGDAISVFSRVGMEASLHISSPNLEDAQELWRRFSHATIALHVPDLPSLSHGSQKVAPPAPRRNRLVRMFRIMIGSE